jgi:hypothetical protein
MHVLDIRIAEREVVKRGVGGVLVGRSSIQYLIPWVLDGGSEYSAWPGKAKKCFGEAAGDVILEGHSVGHVALVWFCFFLLFDFDFVLAFRVGFGFR